MLKRRKQLKNKVVISFTPQRAPEDKSPRNRSFPISLSFDSHEGFHYDILAAPKQVIPGQGRKSNFRYSQVGGRKYTQNTLERTYLLPQRDVKIKHHWVEIHKGSSTLFSKKVQLYGLIGKYTNFDGENVIFERFLERFCSQSRLYEFY